MPSTSRNVCLHCGTRASHSLHMQADGTPIIGGAWGGEPIVCAAHVTLHLCQAYGYTNRPTSERIPTNV
jgi:hypothetical protein